MGKFKFVKTGIKDMFVVEPTFFEDKRGYFMETIRKNDFRDAGYELKFVQDNQSQSTKGVLRGLHLQVNYPQGKLVRVIRGEVFNVGVDLRGDSKTYGEWYGEILSEDNKKTVIHPVGLCTRISGAFRCGGIHIQVHKFYHEEDESGIIWNDPDIAIDWPLDGIDEIILSDKTADKLQGLKKIRY